MGKEYDVSDIKIMEGLEAVRMRPGMYIGSTGVKGLHHMLWEIVDNAVDEAANGFADTVKVTLHRDMSVTVEISFEIVRDLADREILFINF